MAEEEGLSRPWSFPREILSAALRTRLVLDRIATRIHYVRQANKVFFSRGETWSQPTAGQDSRL